MALQPIDMLKRLASGVTPDGARTKRASVPFESRSFASLLLETGRPVRASGKPVRDHHELPEKFELSEDEREKLGLALDKAEAQFMESILAITTAGVLVVDVAERTIRRAEDAPGEELFSGIDGAVVLGGLKEDDSESRDSAERVAHGLRTLGSASLMRVLAQGTTQRDTNAEKSAI